MPFSQAAIWGTQHTVDLIDADDAVLCPSFCGQRHFQMNGNGTIELRFPAHAPVLKDFQQRYTHKGAWECGGK